MALGEALILTALASAGALALAYIARELREIAEDEAALGEWPRVPNELNEGE
jgi:hypothetical protein